MEVDSVKPKTDNLRREASEFLARVNIMIIEDPRTEIEIVAGLRKHEGIYGPFSEDDIIIIGLCKQAVANRRR